jgi:tryptophan synthase alpha subunit
MTSQRRITAALRAAREERRVARVPYVTAGFPELDSTPEIVKALVEGGADAIELGLPFSDPIADGVKVQHSTFRALQNGMTTPSFLELVTTLRRQGVEIPLIVMTYYNPILAYGQDAFVRDAAAASLDGVIAVDLPPDEAAELASKCKAGGLDFIPLLAPTSSYDRIELAVGEASGFVYCVSIAGVTGAREKLPEGLGAFLRRVREKTELPLGVGFGISRPEHIEALRGQADAAIVGSALVDVIEQSPRGEVGERVQKYVEVLTGRKKARI